LYIPSDRKTSKWCPTSLVSRFYLTIQGIANDKLAIAMNLDSRLSHSQFPKSLIISILVQSCWQKLLFYCSQSGLLHAAGFAKLGISQGEGSNLDGAEVLIRLGIREHLLIRKLSFGSAPFRSTLVDWSSV